MFEAAEAFANASVGENALHFPIRKNQRAKSRWAFLHQLNASSNTDPSECLISTYAAVSLQRRRWRKVQALRSPQDAAMV